MIKSGDINKRSEFNRNLCGSKENAVGKSKTKMCKKLKIKSLRKEN